MEIHKWKYNCKITIEHKLALKFSDSIENIHDIIVSEGGKNSPFKNQNQVCINIDKVEKNRAKKEKRNAYKTMDTSFAISYGKKNEMVLCEYKLNYKKPENISKSELDEKIKNSKDLLGNEPNIHSVYIFVFSTKIKSQALNKIRRLNSNKKNFNVVDINELKELYFN